MLNSPRSLFAALLVVCLSSAKAIAIDVRDDFSRDSGQWRASQGGGKGQHLVQNGRLEFSTQGISTENDSATNYLKVNVGRFGESWEVQADVFLGGFQLADKNPYAGLALKVNNTSKPKRSFVRVQLRKGTDDRRAFNADAYTGHQRLGSEWTDTSATTATLKIQFDGKTKMLTASYNADGTGASGSFVTFFSIDIGKGPNAWNMKDGDVFEVSLVSQSVDTIISPGDMYFDNFLAK